LRLTETCGHDLTLAVIEPTAITTHRKLNREEREEVVAWFARNEATLPEPVRQLLAGPLVELQSSKLSQKAFNQ
jgi:hypothetical protein